MKCVAAVPHYGEKWIAVSKNIRNFKMDVEEILRETAERISVF